MARTVDTSSTFETWRQNYNTLATEVGDPAALTTADKSSIVNAINYIMDQYFFFQDFDYDGSDGASSGGSARRLFSGIDNNGTTLAYAASKVLVYKTPSGETGARLLRNGTDYVAVDGTSVLLASSAAAGDTIRISAYTGSYTATPAGQESLFHWQTAGNNIWNRNSGGIVFNAGKAIGSIVTTPTDADSIQFEGNSFYNGNIWMNSVSSTKSAIRFRDDDNSNYVGLQAPATIGGNVTLTLPAAETGYMIAVAGVGTSGQVLRSDGDASYSWTDVSNTNTTYTHTWVDSGANAILRLTDSGSTNDDLTIIAGSGITLTPSGDDLTVGLTSAADPTSITIYANNTNDETIFPVFVDGQTGSQSLETDSSFTYNPGTNTLFAPSITCTSIVGALTGNASTATTATNVTVTHQAGDTTCFPLFAQGATGNLDVHSDTSHLTYNSSTGALSATSFVGTITTASQTNITGVGTITTGVWSGTALVGAKIGNDQIDSQHYVDGSIDTAHIAADAINSAKIEDNAIGNEHLEDDTVGVAELSASGTASSSTFLRGDNSWSAAGTGTVDTSGSPVDNDFAKFTDANTIEGRSYAEVRSDLNVADGATADQTNISGTAAIATTVTITDNENSNEENAIIFTSAGDKDGGNIGLESDGDLWYNPATATLNANSISGILTTAGQTNITAVGTIAVGVWSGTALVGAKIGNDQIDSQHYVDGSIDEAHLATNSVATAAIATGNVTLAKMASQSVDEDNLYISNAGSNGQFLQKQSGNNGGLTWASSTGTITALNNQVANRLVTIGATTTELDGEANLTFDGNILNLTNGGSGYIYANGIGKDSTDYITWSNNNYTSFWVNGAEDMRLHKDDGLLVDGDVTAFSSEIASDIALKENINPITNALDKVLQLGGYSFDWKNKKRGSSTGLIAQEVEKVLPDLVKDQKGLINHKTLNYNGIIGLLVESIKELKNEIESLKNSKS